MIFFNLSHIHVLPVLSASVVGVLIEVLWMRVYQKKKKQSILSFLLRFFALFLVASGIDLLTVTDNWLLGLKQNAWLCLLFVVPCFGLKALEERYSFDQWFFVTLRCFVQFAILGVVMLKVAQWIDL